MNFPFETLNKCVLMGECGERRKEIPAYGREPTGLPLTQGKGEIAFGRKKCKVL